MKFEAKHAIFLRTPKASVENGLIASLTLVSWASATAIGVAGMLLSYPRFHLPPKSPPPLVVERLQVTLTRDPEATANLDPGNKTTQAEPASVQDEISPPALAEPVAVPSAPAMAEVAVPNPAIAFAVPVEGPARIVAPAAAIHTKAQTSSATPPVLPTVPRRITLGVGEGRQPQPEYPHDAIAGDQQGRVVVRFTVTEEGHVAAVEATEPSKWPLLNEAAVRAIADRWRFPKGKSRRYEVEIVFRLDG